MTSFLKICTVFHIVWQFAELSIFWFLQNTVTEIIKKQLRNKFFKLCYELYRNFWFLVKKKNSDKYKLINVILKINRIIIRDVSFSFFVDSFFEQFVNCMMTFFVDLFFDYDQFFFAEKSRDFIVFQIFINLIQMAIFFQNVINSVLQFIRTINQILYEHVSKIVFLFLNDVETKKSQNFFSNMKKFYLTLNKTVLFISNDLM